MTGLLSLLRLNFEVTDEIYEEFFITSKDHVNQEDLFGYHYEGFIGNLFVILCLSALLFSIWCILLIAKCVVKNIKWEV